MKGREEEKENAAEKEKHERRGMRRSGLNKSLGINYTSLQIFKGSSPTMIHDRKT